MLGIYVHIPFCSAICNYCNFNRGLFDRALKRRYVDALIREITDVSAPDGLPAPGRGGDHAVPADTIYFGGGTPSLLDPDDVERIVDACERSFAVAPDREVTLEANPETVTRSTLTAFRQGGVNRLSFGVQSFREQELRRLSRLHSADRARAAVAEAREAGFGNISLDLMMWLPQQSVSEWLESVDEAVAVGPDHLSMYLLEIYPNAPLKDDMARSCWSQAPDDDAAAMYLTAMQRLEHEGYEQYEISNVARPGFRSQHNLKYWTDGEWIGFGCGAHSTCAGVRWKNVSSTEEYVCRIEAGEPTAVDRRQLSPEERLGDALFTGLRLNEGLDVTAIQTRYGVDVWRRYGHELDRFVEGGWLRRDGARLWLTRQGMLLAHEVMTVFV